MKKSTKSGESGIERREFIKFLSVGAAAIGGLSTLAGCSSDKIEAFFQRNFKELDSEELANVLERLEREYLKKYSGEVKNIG